MNQQEVINAIALTRLNYFSLAGLLELYRKLGSATAVMEHRHELSDVVPDVSEHLVEALKEMDEPLQRAEAELEWDQRHHIEAIPLGDPRYPQRLKDCPDAPLVLFFRGSINLNPTHSVAIVGTRQCTMYGQDLIRRFVRDLQLACPDAVIVSGLAYGVDIHAHRSALHDGLDTIGVLAHGLDEIYPPAHRETARQMLAHGGLLTEYMTSTRPGKMNFVRRNRVVAGISDAVVLVESAAKGGGLITCGIAQSYQRPVFAFPGAVDAEYSKGCNQLIRDNEASLITSADDFLNAMGWQRDLQLEHARKEGIERQLFPNLSTEEQQVVNVLAAHNDLQINALSVQSGIAISRLTALLFSMELKGIVKALAGGMYHLMK